MGTRPMTAASASARPNVNPMTVASIATRVPCGVASRPNDASAHARSRRAETGGAAEREQHGFRHQLPRDAAETRAERMARGQLFIRALDSTSIRFVTLTAPRAGRTHAAPEQVERVAEIPDQIGVQRLDDGVEAGVDQNLFQRGEAIEVPRVEASICWWACLDRRAGLEPRDMTSCCCAVNRRTSLQR
jgi:hypothetical protein